MENLPFYIPLIFGLTTILTVALFYKATNYSKSALLILLSWLALQAFVGLLGFYKVTDTIPPRFLLLVLPPLGFIIGLFATSKGRKIIAVAANGDIWVGTMRGVARIGLGK